RIHAGILQREIIGVRAKNDFRYPIRRGDPRAGIADVASRAQVAGAAGASVRDNAVRRIGIDTIGDQNVVVVLTADEIYSRSAVVAEVGNQQVINGGLDEEEVVVIVIKAVAKDRIVCFGAEHDAVRSVGKDKRIGYGVLRTVKQMDGIVPS